jgi:Tfp pilus assembly protein PilN
VKAVNLLPNDLRGAAKTTAERVSAPEATGGAGPFVLLGILAACVAGAAGYVLETNTIKQSQVELADVSARQQALAGQAAKLKPYADFDALAKGRVQTVRDLAGARFDWEQALRDLSRAIPSDVTLKSLSGDVGAASASGGGGSSLRGSIPAPAITLSGCTTGQTQVARLMARLRDVDGVTRVSLSKSDSEKVDPTGATAAQGETQARNAAPCGVGKHPSFEVIAFFENSSAEAVTDGASSAAAAPSAGATATPTPTATPSGSAASTTTTEGAAK